MVENAPKKALHIILIIIINYYYHYYHHYHYYLVYYHHYHYQYYHHYHYQYYHLSPSARSGCGHTTVSMTTLAPPLPPLLLPLPPLTLSTVWLWSLRSLWRKVQ